MLEEYYLKLPAYIQTALVSVSGLMLRATRSSGAYGPARQNILQRNIWRKNQFEAFALSQFSDLVGFAVENVDFYRRNRDKYLRPQFTPADIARIPVLKKELIRNAPSAFIAERIPPGWQKVKTTGTTGTPLAVESDNLSRQLNYAYFDNFLEAHCGVSPFAKHCVLGGRLVCSRTQQRPPFWRYSLAQHSLLMSSYHLSDVHIPHYLDAIRKYSPAYIEGYPSALEAIARFALRVDKPLNVPVLITSAETLDSAQRALIEQGFRGKVFDQYGCAEMSVFAAQCEHGTYHIRQDYGYVEVVDEHENLVGDGEVGELVCTGFLNRRMPLIRYRIGDRGAVSNKVTCPCGLDTSVLLKLEGRRDDVVVCADGARVGRLSPVLKGFPVRQAQYLQAVPGIVELLLVPDDRFIESRDLPMILHAVQLRLGFDTVIHIRLVDEIPRGPGGKFRAVVSSMQI